MVCYNPIFAGSARSISQCKSSSSAALAAPYLNPSPFSTSFTNSNSQTAQNAYNCYGIIASIFLSSLLLLLLFIF